MSRDASSVFKLVEIDEVTVLELRFALDSDAEDFNALYQQFIEPWPLEPGRSCLVDLTKCDYFGSILLGMLVSVRQKTRGARGKFAACGASTRLINVIRSANLDRLIKIYPNREDALSEL